MSTQKLKLPREFPGGILYDAAEEEAVLRVVRAQSPFRYYGPDCQFEVREFEQEFTRFLASLPYEPWPEDTPFLATATNSGTGALEVALDALGVGCGDEVATVGFMWISTISSIVRCRAIPVLIDADETMNLDPDDLRRKVTDRMKVVLLVHMAGEPARIGPIMSFVREINCDREKRKVPLLRVLEDCAQAIGGLGHGIPGSMMPIAWDGQHRLGAFGDAAIFSLQLNKNITSGEGGVIAVRDPQLHRRMQAINDVGFIRDSKGTGNVENLAEQTLVWGQGRRMTEMQGALARVQLRRLDEILRQMRRSHSVLERYVRTKPGMDVRRHETPDGAGHTGGFLLMHLPRLASDDRTLALGRTVSAALRERGILAAFLHDYEVHIYYNIPQLIEKQAIAGECPWGCPHNAFHSTHGYRRGALPNLDANLARTVLIGIPNRLSEEQEEQIKAVFDNVYTAHIAPLVTGLIEADQRLRENTLRDPLDTDEKEQNR